jgi:putative endonuclease
MKWLASLFGRSDMPSGDRGEALAAEWLRARGFEIRHRNLKVDDDEADLVAIDPDGRTVVIVEVKSRASDGTPPEAWVNSRKQFFLTRLASKLLKRREFADRPFRFDVIAVVLRDNAEPEIRHIPGAFESRW